MTTPKQQFKKSMSEYRGALRKAEQIYTRAHCMTIRSANNFLESFIAPYDDVVMSATAWTKLDAMGMRPASTKRQYN